MTEPSPSPAAEEDREGAPVSRALICVGAVGVVFVIGALALFDAKSALSVAFGTALAASNLWALSKIVRAMLPTPEASAAGEQPGSSAAWGVFAILKVLVLIGVVFLAMQLDWIGPIGFVAGYGTLPIGVVLAQLGPR